MKKIIALLLALVMVFALVACGTPVENEGEGGEVITIDREKFFFNSKAEWDGAMPLADPAEGKKVTIGLRTSALCLDYNVGNGYTDWLEEQTGLDIEIITFVGSNSDIGTQISLMVTGEEELPDILMDLSGISMAMGRDFGREGYFVDLTDLFQTDAYYFTNDGLNTYYDDEEERLLVANEILDNITDPVSGRIYQYPALFHNENDNLLAQMWINDEWLAAVGKEKPTTIEELYDVLVAFRDEDPNGNGLKDEIPMIGRDNSRTQDIIGYLVNAFIYYMPKYKFNLNDGVISTPYTADEYREALKWINKLVEEGLLSEMVWTTNNSEMTSLLNPAEGDPYTVGIAAGVAEYVFTPQHESIFKYSALMPLADAGYGTGGYSPKYCESIHYSTYITHSCEDPQLAFRLLDFMCSSESYLRQRWGVKGVDWDYVDPAENRRGMLGGVARIETYGDDVCFGYANNQCWHNVQSMCSESYWQYVLEDETAWNYKMYQGMADNIAYSDATGMPEEFVFALTRNEAEDEVYQEYNSEIASVISKARADFCIGRRDIEDDAEWQKYLNDLEAVNYSESWIKVAQSAYNRSVGLEGLF